MPHYKGKDGQLHFLDDSRFFNILPEGCVEISDQEADDLRNPPPTTEQIIQGFVAEIQKRLDDFAETRGYDGIMSACTYATSTVAKFKAEGQYCVEARDETWNTAYQMLEEAGDTVPTMAEVFDQLPQLAWPN